MKPLIELYETRIVYRIGYEDDDIDDEYDVIKLDNNGIITWSVESVMYGSILNSSKVGKKLITFCQNQ